MSLKDTKKSKITHLRSISKEEDKRNSLPAGATILKKDVNISVEEVENGFIISKSFDIRFQPKGSDHSDYLYYTKKWYSEDNPLSIETEDKSLADLFDE